MQIDRSAASSDAEGVLDRLRGVLYERHDLPHDGRGEDQPARARYVAVEKAHWPPDVKDRISEHTREGRKCGPRLTA